MKMLLIDGNSMIAKDYYGNGGSLFKMGKITEDKLLHTTTGLYTNAISVALARILKLLANRRYDFFAIAFDEGHQTFRHTCDATYKAHRDPSPSSLIEQIRTMKMICKRIGIPTYSSLDWEADDLVGSLAYQFKKTPDLQIEIITGDQDYLQLVDNNVTVFLTKQKDEDAVATCANLGMSIAEIQERPLKTVPYTPARVKADIGLSPAQVIDLKGLYGDTSDGYKGVNGIGEETAIKLLQEFNSITNIYDEIDKDVNKFTEKCKALGLTRAVKPLLAGKDDAMHCRMLATIRTDAIVENSIGNLATGLCEADLLAILDTYELNDIKNNILPNEGVQMYLTKKRKVLNLGIIASGYKNLNPFYPVIRKLTQNNMEVNLYTDAQFDGYAQFTVKPLKEFKGENKALLCILPDVPDMNNLQKLINLSKDMQVRLAINTGSTVTLQKVG